MLIQWPDEDLSIRLQSPFTMLDLASSSSKFSDGGLMEWSKDLMELTMEIHIKEQQKLSFCGYNLGF